MGLIGAKDQRMTVRLSTGHGDAADRAGAAATVVHHDRLAEVSADRVRDQPRGHIDRTAWRVGHHDGDGAVWKVFGAGAAHGGKPGQRRQSRPPRDHGATL